MIWNTLKRIFQIAYIICGVSFVAVVLALIWGVGGEFYQIAATVIVVSYAVGSASLFAWLARP